MGKTKFTEDARRRAKLNFAACDVNISHVLQATLSLAIVST